ncbi:MAG: class I SAM-dependent RNA methyltransferase [Acidobacteria bacterium]|nr:class I SAM-dependent RNA methyltransferase [Acidobacteriota bacterium]
MAEIRAGDAFEAVVERVVPGGEGLARTDGVVTLVAGALPGDRVRLRVDEVSPRLIRGRAEAILEAGEARRPDADVCALALSGACGGCDWPAARLEHHRALKTELVLDALRRLGGLKAEDLPEPRWLGSPPNYRLRNRLHLGREGRLGFFAPRSNAVADLEGCQIVSKPFLARLPALREHLRSLGPLEGELATLESRDGKTLLGELRLGELRLGGGDGGGPGISLKVKKGPLDGFRVVDAGGRVVGSEGPSSLSIVAGGASFDVSVSSFFQGNLFLLDSFLEEIRAALRGLKPRRAVDLYAGVGFMTRPLLELAAEAGGGDVTAVEIDESSAHSLSKNLSIWASSGLPHARAVRASAESFFHSKKSESPLSLLLADPPRAGLSPEVRRGILRLAPPHVLMVSCDPPTLARDVAALRERYAVTRLTLLDLFPQTHHVETVALLARRPIG